MVSWSVSLPLDRPSLDRISARGHPTDRSHGRQIALIILCTTKVIFYIGFLLVRDGQNG